MKNFKEYDQMIFEFGDDTKFFAHNYAGTMSSGTRTQMQEFMSLKFMKELEVMCEQDELEIKLQKKFYDKLLKVKCRLVKLDRADAWFDRVFKKYFNLGILEHLIVYAILFLYKKNLFVSKRLFSQLNNDELLAEFTVSACNYLGWTGQNEPVEQPTTDETELEDKQPESDEESDNGDETESAEASADVVLYEPKQVQPAEQQSQPVVKVERTVTHEVMTATKAPVENENGQMSIDFESVDDAVDEPDSSFNSEKKAPHRFHRPGGKSSNN